MSFTCSCVTLLLIAITFTAAACAADADGDRSRQMLHLTLRSRTGDLKNPQAPSTVSEKTADWDTGKTAIIVVDMWDQHWCKGAAARVAEMARPMNEMLKTARGRGVLIIHAPSSVASFYDGTPQRKLAQSAPFSPTPVPLSSEQRWGTAWIYPDKTREAELPIDDSDMGCDCDVHCKIAGPWTKENSLIEIAPADAVTDNGQECWNLLQSRGIDNVILCGVHLNMCVLGRPVGIRQMVRLGKNVALMRDMTDTMYNHEMRPKVSHFQGTQLVIEHVEKYWCPSFTSADITGGKAFQFKDDTGQIGDKVPQRHN